jgi:DNA-binding MarR family transcriptional regulator
VKNFVYEQSVTELSELADIVLSDAPLPVRAYIQFRLLHRLLSRLAEMNIEEQGVRWAYYGVLACLYDQNPSTPTELKARALVSRSNMTTLLDRMERDGLIRREPDRHDRRKIQVYLTEQGERISEQVIPAHLDWIDTTLSNLTEDELQQFNQLLEKLWRGLARQAQPVEVELVKDMISIQPAQKADSQD